jgi:hypothetical protein
MRIAYLRLCICSLDWLKSDFRVRIAYWLCAYLLSVTGMHETWRLLWSILDVRVRIFVLAVCVSSIPGKFDEKPKMLLVILCIFLGFGFDFCNINAHGFGSYMEPIWKTVKHTYMHTCNDACILMMWRCVPSTTHHITLIVILTHTHVFAVLPASIWDNWWGQKPKSKPWRWMRVWVCACMYVCMYVLCQSLHTVRHIHDSPHVHTYIHTYIHTTAGSCQRA